MKNSQFVETQRLQFNQLTFDVIYVPHYDNLNEFVVGEVWGPEGHHKIPQPDQSTVGVGEHSDNHVVLRESNVLVQ